MGTLNPQSLIDYSPVSIDSNLSSYDYQTAQLSLVPVRSNLRSWRYRGVKRAIDVVGAGGLMVVCLIPGILIALAVRLTTKGPVFYREVRIGRNKRPFQILKFCSMAPKPSHHFGLVALPHREVMLRWRVQKDIPDPRITKIGSVLRKWSLDELPQLINVLRGDMSLVGPRPVVRSELPLYKHLEGFYLAATPGLSGLWQVSGRSTVSFAARAQLDASYVQSWSLTKDLMILARTVPAVLRRVGAR